MLSVIVSCRASSFPSTSTQNLLCGAAMNAERTGANSRHLATPGHRLFEASRTSTPSDGSRSVDRDQVFPEGVHHGLAARVQPELVENIANVILDGVL